MPFWVAIALVCAVLLPFFVPLLDKRDLFAWGGWVGDVPMSLAALIALGHGWKGLPDGAEKRLWHWVWVAFLISLFAELVTVLLPERYSNPASELSIDVLYLMYYLTIMLAPVAALPASRRADWTPQLLRHLALGLAGVGFLLYSQTVPYHVDPEGVSWYPGLFLYAALDLVAVVIFLRARSHQSNSRLRSILALLAAIHLMYAIGDTAEGVLWLDAFVNERFSPLWDTAWWIPDILLVVGARLAIATPDAAVRRGETWYAERPDRGSLVCALCVIPFGHALLYYAGVLDPSFRSARDAVVVSYLLGVGVMVFLYFRAVERLRGDATSELELSEERYRSLAYARTDGLYRAESSRPVPIDAAAPALTRTVEEAFEVADAVDDEPPPWGGPPSVGRPLFSVLRDAGIDTAAFLDEWVARGFSAATSVSYDAVDGSPRHATLALVGIVRQQRLERVWLARSDVTDERNAQAQASSLGEELRQARKLESLGTLAGGIAHDFNNLLQPIVGFAEMAYEDVGDDPDAARESLARVMAASGKAADLVEQILAVSRRQPVRSEAVDINDVIRDAVKLVRAGLPPRINVVVELGDDLPSVDGDAARLHQVVMNLCTNAAQAIGDEVGDVTISTHAGDGDPGEVIVTVRDSGAGVPPEVADRVFDPFFTTKPVGEGTGLGLSVVHGIVLSHDGEIDLDSSSSGTTVTVRLPVGAHTPTDVDPAKPLPGRPLSILLVDDDQAVISVTRRMLETEGHRVEAYVDPRLALERVRSGTDPFDVAVTDSWMPHMSGSDFARALREERPDIGLVLSSGYHFGAEPDLKPFVTLRKPFVRSELHEALVRASGEPFG
ncbi:MAG: ATP-binding protein [Gemmatimonadota bacterium]